MDRDIFNPFTASSVDHSNKESYSNNSFYFFKLVRFVTKTYSVIRYRNVRYFLIPLLCYFLFETLLWLKYSYKNWIYFKMDNI